MYGDGIQVGQNMSSRPGRDLDDCYVYSLPSMLSQMFVEQSVATMNWQSLLRGAPEVHRESHDYCRSIDQFRKALLYSCPRLVERYSPNSLKILNVREGNIVE